jgi:dsRNA-specific ribonuclease
VNGEMCASLSRQLRLNDFVLLSSQIETNNGRKNKNILEDTFEAFIGAVFLDFEEKEQSGF